MESFKVGWYPPKKTGSSHLNSEGNLAGIFVEGKETDFALLLQVRRRKTFRIKKDQKNHSIKVDNCPKTGRSQARNLEIKTD